MNAHELREANGINDDMLHIPNGVCFTNNKDSNSATASVCLKDGVMNNVSSIESENLSSFKINACSGTRVIAAPSTKTLRLEAKS